MKIRKIIKQAIALIGITFIPLTMSAIFNNQPRNIKKYDTIFKTLWDKLGIHERTDKKIKIGIIDAGLVDFRMMKFNGKTTNNIDQQVPLDNYNIIKYANDQNLINSDRVIYDSRLTDEKIFKFENNKSTFLNYWEKNEHSTNIASIIAGDGGLLKNAEIYSTSFKRNYAASDLDILTENLEFFRKNGVKYINMSYSDNILNYLNDEKLEDFIKEKKTSKINDIIKQLKKIINKDYSEEAALLDKYAFENNMKFFISAGNFGAGITEKVKIFKETLSNYINKKKIDIEIRNLLIKFNELLDINNEFWKKPSQIQRSKNTFIIGAYNFYTDKIKDYSQIKIKNFEDSPLGLGPTEFSNQSLLLNDDWYNTDTTLDDPGVTRWSGTSNSTPVILAASALLETIKRPDSEFDVPELKAILMASFDLRKYGDHIFDLPDNIGAGFFNWERMKFFADNVHKQSIRDLYTNDKGINYKTLISGSDNFLAVYSSYSDLFQIRYREREKLSKETIQKYVNIFDVHIKSEIYATPEWIYKQYHVSTMKSNYKSFSDDYGSATNRIMLSNQYYKDWPYEATLQIKLRKNFTDIFLQTKYMYYILTDRNAIYESRSKLET
ncbi:S8 family serine peptidase [Mycoplasma sp. 6243]|uniref:S8 family serine peptidase n=1 Tax=Mycoplasma sp. 6243 TaxID=3440865 RepID=UPI003EB93738